MFYLAVLDIALVHLHTKFHTHSYKGSFVIDIRLKAIKCTLRAVAMFFGLQHIKMCLSKSFTCLYFNNYQINFHNPILIGASVTFTSEVRAAATVVVSWESWKQRISSRVAVNRAI
jgi:hypothetical protein